MSVQVMVDGGSAAVAVRREVDEVDRGHVEVREVARAANSRPRYARKKAHARVVPARPVKATQGPRTRTWEYFDQAPSKARGWLVASAGVLALAALVMVNMGDDHEAEQAAAATQSEAEAEQAAAVPEQPTDESAKPEKEAESPAAAEPSYGIGGTALASSAALPPDSSNESIVEEAATPDPRERRPAPEPVVLTPQQKREEATLLAAVESGRIMATPEVFASPVQETGTFWDSGIEACASFEVDGLGGWRLPSRGELRSLARAGKLASGTYWSRQQAPRDTEAAYVYDTSRRKFVVWLKEEPNGDIVCVRPRPH